MLKHQLPARSPVPPPALLRTAPVVRRAVGPRAPLSELMGLLQRDHGQPAGVVLTGSGTHALALAIRAALRRNGGGLVALPAYSCFDLVTAAVAADVRIVFYDVDPDTLSPDLNSLSVAVGAGVSAVVAAPLYGIPIDWQAMTAVVRAAGALLIEDAAQSFGSLHNGGAIGTFGDLTVLSFGRGKGWTGGGGGALLVREAGQAEVVHEILAESMPRPGGGTWLRAAAASVLGRPGVYALPAFLPWLKLGRTVYREPAQLRLMHEGTAALVLATHAASLHEVRLRRINAAGYRKELRTGNRWRHITPHPCSRASWLRYPLRLAAGNQEATAPQLVRAGMAPGYPRALPDLDAAAGRIAVAVPCPGAAELVRSLVTLPTHGRIARIDREQVRAALMEAPAPATHDARGRRRLRHAMVTAPGGDTAGE